MRVITLTMIVFTLSLSSCGRDEESKTSLRTVKSKQIFASNGVRVRAFAGLTRSGSESKLSFRIPGTINHLPIKVGDQVKGGDVIAQIDPRDYSLQVEETEASLLQAQAQERHAAASYARYRDLYETRSTSRNELDAARADAESASAAVEAMQKKLALARSQLSYSTLHAPQNGTVAAVNVEKNENIAVGEPVIILNSGTNLEVEVSIPEILISQINREDKVTVGFDSLPGEYFTGTVTEVGVTSSGGTTFPVIIELDRSPSRIRPGMAAEVLFEIPDSNQGFRYFVPSRAVIGQGKDHYVYVIIPHDEETGRIEKREVSVGELTNAGIEIVTGIHDGEFVVTAGLQALRDGQKVKMR